MSRRVLTLFVGAVALALVAIPSWARNSSNNALSGNIELGSTISINNTQLAPGEYKVIADGNQARIEKDGKVVAELPCTLKTLSRKAAETDVLTDRDHLTEIQIAGKTEAIEFSGSQSSGN